MSDKSRAAAFSARVDELLARKGKAEQPLVTSIEDALELDLARRLAEVDLSTQSRALGMLPGEIGVRTARRPAMSRLLRFTVKPVTLAAAVLVIALIVVQCTYPGGVPAASKEVSQAVSRLVLSEMRVGPHTVAQQSTGDRQALEEAVAAIPQEEKDRMWHVEAGGVGFGGSSPKGVGPAALELGSIEEARGKAAFRFTTPAVLPDGTAVSKVYLSPVGDDVILVYAGAGAASFAISEFAVSSSAASATISDEAYQQTTVGSAPAAWYPSGVLVWENDGISYTIGAPGMGEDEARRIAESMR
jgi:hypothetical protein